MGGFFDCLYGLQFVNEKEGVFGVCDEYDGPLAVLDVAE